VLPDSQIGEKNVVLGTYTKVFSQSIHIIEYFESLKCSRSRCWFQQTCEHWDGSSFTSSVVTK